MFHFYNTFLNSFNISSLFSGGIIISSTGFGFTILLSFNLATASAILFPINSPVLWTTFFEAVFQIKDKSKFDHQHDLVYHAKCPSELCDKNYIGESGRRITEE